MAKDRRKAYQHTPTGTWRLPLTKGYETVLDPEDVECAELRSWSVQLPSAHGHSAYAACRERVAGRGKTVYLHRVLAVRAGLEIKGLEVDHINLNGLDNRRANLRCATRSENKYNVGKRRDNTSGYKGVCWDKSRNKWAARISVQGVGQNLGRFDTPEAAYAVYCAAAEQLHRDFRRTQ